MSGVAADLRDVTVVVGERQILGPVSLRIGNDEHWAVLGPNGAGKTTLLSLLGAARHPTTGSAEILGAVMGRADLRQLRKRIATVGQSVADGLPRHKSALEIVLTGKEGLLAPWWGTFDGADRGSRATELLARLRVDHLAEQAFGRLSQGERQRVLIARSLLARSDLVLLDEPAVGVDLPGREALVRALDELAESVDAAPSVHVAHTLEELPGSTTHALLLRDAVPVGSGPVDEVLSDAGLSACYGLPVRVTRAEGRWAARADSSW